MRVQQASPAVKQSRFNTIIVEFNLVGKRGLGTYDSMADFAARLMPQGWGARPEPLPKESDLVIAHEGEGKFRYAGLVTKVQPQSGCTRVEFSLRRTYSELSYPIQDELAEILRNRSRRAAQRLMLAYYGATRFPGSWQALYPEEQRRMRTTLAAIHEQQCEVVKFLEERKECARLYPDIFLDDYPADENYYGNMRDLLMPFGGVFLPVEVE